jgi:hypothetical protein
MWDLSLPGYKYLGPGNSLDKGKPEGYNDWVAYFHDHGYKVLQDSGQNPYINWNAADAKAYREFDATKDYGGAAGKFFFGLKKLAADYNIIGTGESLNNLPCRSD